MGFSNSVIDIASASIVELVTLLCNRNLCKEEIEQLGR